MVIGEVDDGDPHDSVEAAVRVGDRGFEFLPKKLLLVGRRLSEGTG
jgi:hypothetical protein